MNNNSDVSGTATDNTSQQTAKPSDNGSTIVPPMQAADNQSYATVMAQMNAIDYTKLGFPQDFQITGIAPAASTSGGDLSQTAGNRQMQAQPDGSFAYQAQAGDSYWRVASDVLTTRQGAPASNKDVLAYVQTLADYNKKADPNKLAIGETINIPAAEAAAADAQPTGDDAQTPQASAPADATAPQTPQASAPADATAPQTSGTVDAPVSQQVSAPLDATAPQTPDTIDAQAPQASTPVETTANPAGLKVNDDRIAAQDDNFNPIATPGQGVADFGQNVSSPVGMLHDRSALPIVPLADGGSSDSYTGSLNNGTWFTNWNSTSFAGTESVDKDGNLTHRETTYNDGNLPPIKFLDESGNVVAIDNVKSVVTDRDVDGTYKSMITDNQGQQWIDDASASGQTLSLQHVTSN